MAKINYSAAELEALLDSVKPKLTYARTSSNLGTLADLQTWLDGIISGMSAYGIRFVSFTPTDSYALFRKAVYNALVSKGGNNAGAVCIFYKTTGSYNATYPTLIYMRKANTWDNPVTIQA